MCNMLMLPFGFCTIVHITNFLLTSLQRNGSRVSFVHVYCSYKKWYGTSFRQKSNSYYEVKVKAND